MSNLLSRLPGLTTILWILACLVAVGAFLFIAPNLLNPPGPKGTPTGAVLTLNTPQATATEPPTLTPLPAAPAAVQRTSIPLPTPPPGAVAYDFMADPTRSGYLKSNEDKAHWGDRNLHAGAFGGDAYSSVLFFDISALPPNSNILSADLALTGLSRDNLGAQGEWRASLLHAPPFQDWTALTTQDLISATTTTTIGNQLSPGDLDLGQTNEFQFTTDQLPALTNDVENQTYLAVRLEGPTGSDNSLFTWDGGGLDLKTGAHPTLRIVAEPGQFVIVTNTPTAENVVTAAALAVNATTQASSLGPPTPFPRTYATATPIILVTQAPTPANVETRVALAQMATAVAITTGTYTPTPPNWVEITPTFTPFPTRTPMVVPASTLYARLTPTAPPTSTPTTKQLLAMPMPAFLQGKILVMTDRFKDPTIAVMQPDGTIVQGLTGDEFYNLAAVREPFSPDRTRRAIVAPDANGLLQIWVEDQTTHESTPITHNARGIAYDPVWSPDGGSIAYVSRELGNDEIYIYDLGARTARQLTHGGNPLIYKQRPTWSPDGNRLAFKANDGTLNFQIWLIDADGSNLQNISKSDSNDIDPIWVK